MENRTINEFTGYSNGYDAGFDEGYNKGFDDGVEEVKSLSVLLDTDLLDGIYELKQKIMNFYIEGDSDSYDSETRIKHNQMVCELNRAVIDFAKNYALGQIYDYWDECEEEAKESEEMRKIYKVFKEEKV